MNTILLNTVVPEPVADITTQSSEIWLRERQFERGKRYLIHAESGVGKSSLFDFLYGRRNDYRGSIFYDNQPLSSFKVKRWNELRQHAISLVFQGFRLFPELTVWENIQLKNQLTNHLSPEIITEMLAILGIENKRHIALRWLSYGQQQRVAIIRALCQPFDFLLLDEPFSHLDVANQQIICNLVDEQLRRQGAGLMICSLGDPYFFRYDDTLKM